MIVLKAQRSLSLLHSSLSYHECWFEVKSRGYKRKVPMPNRLKMAQLQA